MLGCFVLIQVHIQAVARGLARHTPSDVGKIGQGDVVAISKFLADKPFMFGDQPRLVGDSKISLILFVVCLLGFLCVFFVYIVA